VRKIPFHYGLIIVATGTLCNLACIGLGRFTLGMLLPSMAGSLNLTYSQMGIIGTMNFVGYLAAVLVSGFLEARLGAVRLIFAALILVGSSMLLLGLVKSFLFAVLLYTLTGVGSGAANVPTMGIVTRWFTRQKRGRASGYVVIGSGFAIVLSGRLVPFINSVMGAEGWRTSWFAIGAAVLVIAFICAVLLRNRPEDMGLSPVGDKTCMNGPLKASSNPVNVYTETAIHHLGIIYFIFGCTYVIYATFIITTLVKEMGFTEHQAGGMWTIVGFLSLFSGPLFGGLSDRMGRRAGLIAVFSLQTISYLLAALGLRGIPIYISMCFFGITAWSVPSIMAAAVGDYVGTEGMFKAFGFITFIFGIGQIIGPFVAGLLAETSGSFSGSFLVAGILAAAAVYLSFRLKRRQNGGLED
jgi:MFS family permease